MSLLFVKSPGAATSYEFHFEYSHPFALTSTAFSGRVLGVDIQDDSTALGVCIIQSRYQDRMLSYETIEDFRFVINIFSLNKYTVLFILVMFPMWCDVVLHNG